MNRIRDRLMSSSPPLSRHRRSSMTGKFSLQHNPFSNRRSSTAPTYNLPDGISGGRASEKAGSYSSSSTNCRITSEASGKILQLSTRDVTHIRRIWNDIPDKTAMIRRMFIAIFNAEPRLRDLFGFQLPPSTEENGQGTYESEDAEPKRKTTQLGLPTSDEHFINHKEGGDHCKTGRNVNKPNNSISSRKQSSPIEDYDNNSNRKGARATKSLDDDSRNSLKNLASQKPVNELPNNNQFASNVRRFSRQSIRYIASATQGRTRTGHVNQVMAGYTTIIVPHAEDINDRLESCRRFACHCGRFASFWDELIDQLAIIANEQRNAQNNQLSDSYQRAEKAVVTLIKTIGQKHANMPKVSFEATYWLLFKTEFLRAVFADPYYSSHDTTENPLAASSLPQHRSSMGHVKSLLPPGSRDPSDLKDPVVAAWHRLLAFVSGELKSAFHTGFRLRNSTKRPNASRPHFPKLSETIGINCASGRLNRARIRGGRILSRRLTFDTQNSTRNRNNENIDDNNNNNDLSTPADKQYSRQHTIEVSPSWKLRNGAFSKLNNDDDDTNKNTNLNMKEYMDTIMNATSSTKVERKLSAVRITQGETDCFSAPASSRQARCASTGEQLFQETPNQHEQQEMEIKSKDQTDQRTNGTTENTMRQNRADKSDKTEENNHMTETIPMKSTSIFMPSTFNAQLSNETKITLSQVEPLQSDINTQWSSKQSVEGNTRHLTETTTPFDTSKSSSFASPPDSTLIPNTIANVIIDQPTTDPTSLTNGATANTVRLGNVSDCSNEQAVLTVPYVPSLHLSSPSASEINTDNSDLMRASDRKASPSRSGNLIQRVLRSPQLLRKSLRREKAVTTSQPADNTDDECEKPMSNRSAPLTNEQNSEENRPTTSPRQSPRLLLRRLLDKRPCPLRRDILEEI